MQQLKFLNVFGAVSILFLAGACGYIIGVQTSRAPGVIQNESPSLAVDQASSSIDITNVLGGILKWKVDQAVQKTLMCDDGTATAQTAKIVRLGVGPINPKENTVQQAVIDIRKALANDQWTRCRSAGIGENIEETYRKNNQLFQMEAEYSAGTGNTLDLYFEYSS